MLSCTRILLLYLIVTASFAVSAGAQVYPLGDLNVDRKVDWEDLRNFSRQWLDRNYLGSDSANLDGVGAVDMFDFSLLAGNWQSERKIFPYRLIYVSKSVRRDSDVEQITRIVKTASEHGFNGIVLAAALDRLDSFSPDDLKGLEQAKQTCRQYGVEIIPIIFSVGRAWSVLNHDRNLAVGIPVKDALFIVKNDEAHLVPDFPIEIINGGFEEYDDNIFAGYAYHDEPGKVSFADTEVFRSGKASIRFEVFDPYWQHARVMQEVEVHPHRCYRLSCWVRTEQLEPAGSFRMLVLSPDGRILAAWYPQVPATSEWQKVVTGFNSFNCNSVRVYLGLSIWGNVSGKFWVDDLSIEEIGPLNVLRRPGTPVTVTSEETGLVYEEGRDFAPIEDPVLDFRFDRDPPSIKILPEKSGRIRTGQRLRVSYHHGMRLFNDRVAACMSEPRVYEIWRQQARLIHKYLAPKKYFLSMDEVGAGGSCQACKERKMTMGQILGDCVAKQVQIIREVDAGAEILIWSDMFDPYHNARENYFLIDGDLTGSWEYVPKDVIVACWSYETRNESLGFFESCGFRTLAAAYFDDETLENSMGWIEALNNTPKACGVMYTTWENEYEQLGEFGDLVTGTWN